MSLRFTFALALLMFVSCTVTKRHYRKGFHVQWHHRYAGAGPTGAEKLQDIALGDTLAPVPTIAGPSTSVHDMPQHVAPISNRPFRPVGHLRMPPAVSSPCPHMTLAKKPLYGYNGLRTKPAVDDDYIDTAYALRKANLSLWLGILGLAGFFVLSFWMLIVAVQAIRAGQQAMLVNSSIEDPLVERRAKAGIRMGRAIIYVCEVMLLMILTILLVYFFLALGFSSGVLIPVLGFLCLVFAGLFVWMYIGLEKYLKYPDLRAKRRRERNDGVIRIRQ